MNFEFFYKGKAWLQRRMGLIRPASPPPVPEVDAMLSALVQDQVVPGMAISICCGDQMLMQKGYGYANLETGLGVNPGKTLFRAASVSKPIAACALASLVAEGKMELDSSFYSYVPYFPKKEYDFTLRQLASHTAGIRGYRGREFMLNQPIGIRDSLAIFKDDPLVFPPGEGYRYNSFDWVLLSLAMEEVTGVPFSDYTRKVVLEPLQMNHTCPEIPGAPYPAQACFYTRRASGFRMASPVDNRFKLAGGGYLTTVNDLITFGKAILGQDFYPGVLPEFLTAQKVLGKSTFYGLGWEVSEDAEGRTFYGHIGNQVGGYSYFRVFPQTGLVVAALINCTDPKIQKVLDEVVHRYNSLSL